MYFKELSVKINLTVMNHEIQILYEMNIYGDHNYVVEPDQINANH